MLSVTVEQCFEFNEKMKNNIKYKLRYFSLHSGSKMNYLISNYNDTKRNNTLFCNYLY